MIRIYALALLTYWRPSAFAQVVHPAGRQNSPNARLRPDIAIKTPHFSEPITSLDDLIKLSPIIVEARIVSVYPAISRASDRPREIETHSLVSVVSVLKGAFPNDGSTFILAQEGGEIGGQRTMVEGDPIVASGEMYVLFLTRDDRKKPDQGDLPRYLTIQAGAGKIAVPAEPSPERPFVGKMFREYSHLTSRELFFALKQRIQRSSAPIVDVVPTYPFTGRPISAGTGTNQGKTDKTKQ